MREIKIGQVYKDALAGKFIGIVDISAQQRGNVWITWVTWINPETDGTWPQDLAEVIRAIELGNLVLHAPKPQE